MDLKQDRTVLEGLMMQPQRVDFANSGDTYHLHVRAAERLQSEAWAAFNSAFRARRHAPPPAERPRRGARRREQLPPADQRRRPAEARRVPRLRPRGRAAHRTRRQRGRTAGLASDPREARRSPPAGRDARSRVAFRMPACFATCRADAGLTPSASSQLPSCQRRGEYHRARTHRYSATKTKSSRVSLSRRR